MPAVSWDGISAIGSIVGAVVLLVAAITAIVQLKHLRLANQMGSYLELMRQLSTPGNGRCSRICRSLLTSTIPRPCVKRSPAASITVS